MLVILEAKRTCTTTVETCQTLCPKAVGEANKKMGKEKIKMANGMACYHHTSQPAVAQCSKCGKGICKNCHDGYKGVCYDCTLEAANEKLNDAKYKEWDAVDTLKKMKTGGIIGGIIGIVFGIAASVIALSVDNTKGLDAIGGILGAIIVVPIWGICFGSTIVTAIKIVYVVTVGFIDVYIFKNYGLSAGCLEKLFGAFFTIAVTPSIMIYICPIVLLIMFFKKKKQKKKAGKEIEEYQIALEQLHDYHKSITAV
jgi:uncharacterized membrane protein